MSIKWTDLGTLLLQYGLINAEDLKEGLELQKRSRTRLGEALVKLGKVTMEDIDWILSKQLDIPFVIVEDVTPNIELLEKFKRDFLIQNKILPLYETDDHISIVIEDPFNDSAIDLIEKDVEKEVSISTGSGSRIEELLRKTFNKVGLPVLVDVIKDVTERTRETSFYRIDFILAENACEVGVFGFGIKKNIHVVKGRFSPEEVFRAFGDLEVPVLYEQSFSNGRKFLAVYPLIKEGDVKSYPAIIGEYGLCYPEGTAFTDAHVYGAHHIFPLAHPMAGYPCLATKKSSHGYNKSVYTIDSAPDDFEECYVRLCVPRTCISCKGAGCKECKELGYVFTRIEGMFSSDDLNEKLKED
jgi:type IV pilus assembly protein PilB